MLERKRWWRQLSLLFLYLIPQFGCNIKEIDYLLVDKIWEDVKAVTNLDTFVEAPKIEFLQKENPEIYGAYFPQDQKIEIYLGTIVRNVWYYRKNYGLGYKESQALYYNIVAHEMLHHALHLKGVPRKQRHRVMKNSKYLEKVVDSINNYFQIKPEPDGALNKRITLESLDQGVVEDLAEEIVKK